MRLLLSLVGCLLLSQFSDAAPPPSRTSRRNLLDGAAACAGCDTSTLKCSGKTILDDHCAPCATGQTWWPCNIVDECYCKDLAAEQLKQEQEQQMQEELASKCNLPLCAPGESGNKIVPFTNCAEFVACTSGVPGTIQTCPEGLAYSERISACNVLSMVTCPEDPTCPPSSNPTVSPTGQLPLAIQSPSTSVPPTPSSPGGKGGLPAGVMGGGGDIPVGVPPASPPTRPDPDVLEGMYVMDAHMAANKIALSRELLAGPGGGMGGPDGFSYLGLRSSLRTMIVTGAGNQTFYIGDSSSENGRAYGLVNIAAFLAMSAEDSISHGSCDEVNRDTVGGVLPISNACGQGGRSYHEMTCPAGEEEYACEVDPTMRAQANEADVPRGGAGGGDDGAPPSKPFYCGPTSDYDGYTGHWDYVSGTETSHPPVENGSGKTDVEG